MTSIPPKKVRKIGKTYDMGAILGGYLPTTNRGGIGGDDPPERASRECILSPQRRGSRDGARRPLAAFGGRPFRGGVSRSNPAPGWPPIS